MPADVVFDVEGLDPDVAVFTEPAACALHGLETLEPAAGSTALVFGAGSTGLLLAQLLATGGVAHVTVAAPRQNQLDRAPALGIDATVLIDRDCPEESGASSTSTPRAGTTTSSRRPAPRASAPSASASPGTAAP